MKIWTKLSPNTSNSSPAGRPAMAESRPAAAPRPAEATRAKVLKPTPPRSPAERPDLPVADRFSGRPLGAVGGRPTERRTLRQWMADHPFLMWVVLPSLAAAFYLFFIAAPQYVSEARFTVRAQQPRAGSANISGELLGSAGFITSPENIASVRTFLLSHDSVRKSRETLDLVDIFRRPEADPLFRLWWANPTAERLRSWFRWQVTVDVDPTTGISDLRVWTFRPDDSKALSLRLMEIAEELVNDMNVRIREEALRSARTELRRAETRLTDARVALTMFRQQERAVDPSATASAAVSTISGLESDIARARSELQTLQGFARPNSPQIINLQNRIRGMEAQVAEERERIAAAGTGVTELMETFARLNAEVGLAQQQLEANIIVLDRANSDVARQSIFLLRIVEPNLAERSLFPLPYWLSLYIFISLSIVYGLAWLILTGMREHAR